MLPQNTVQLNRVLDDVRTESHRVNVRMVEWCCRDTTREKEYSKSLRSFELNNGQLNTALDDACANGVAGETGGVVDVEFGH
jgi:hypothetical protein